ncbi:MAG TPA: DUF5994 family protein [Candidatus Limnocylindrales bacterium]
MSTPAPFNPDLTCLVPGSPKSVQRLYLEPTGSHEGMLDGAWWPRTRSPATELPGLISTIDAVRGRVLRLVLAATGWDDRPRRLIVGGRAVVAEYLGSQPASLLTAFYARARVDLLVIPPNAGQREAQEAMIQAMSDGARATTAAAAAASWSR